MNTSEGERQVKYIIPLIMIAAIAASAGFTNSQSVRWRKLIGPDCQTVFTMDDVNWQAYKASACMACNCGPDEICWYTVRLANGDWTYVYDTGWGSHNPPLGWQQVYRLPCNGPYPGFAFCDSACP